MTDQTTTHSGAADAAHWEKRALDAEYELDALREELAPLLSACDRARAVRHYSPPGEIHAALVEIVGIGLEMIQAGAETQEMRDARLSNAAGATHGDTP